MWVSTAMALLLLGAGAWSWSTGDQWLGATLIAFGAAFPVAKVLVASLRGRKDVLGIPPEAIQPGILAVLCLTVGVCQFAGIGLRPDYFRGVMGLVAATVMGYVTVIIARAYCSRD